jgi:chloride channel 7
MFSFGEFYSLQGERSNYSVWELSLFMLLGAMGGLIGAAFNSLNVILFNWRKDMMPLKYFYLRLLEAVVVVIIMSLLAFLLPVLWSKCTPLPVDMEGWSDQEKTLVTELVCMYCNKGTHYNELASLYLTDSDTSIKQLFHFREIGDDNASTFSSFALFLFVVPYIIMACVTNGVSVPAGTNSHYVLLLSLDLFTIILGLYLLFFYPVYSL